MLAVVVIGATAWFLSTGPVTDEPEPVTAAETPAEITAAPSPEPQEPPAPLDIDDAVEFVETRASSGFRQMLTETAASMGIVYRTGDQLAVLDFARGEIAPLTDGLVRPAVPAAELLRTADGITWAIDPVTREATVVADEGYVLETIFPGIVTRVRQDAFRIQEGEQATVGRLDGTAPQLQIPLPAGGFRTPIPGLGLVVFSDDGSGLVGLGAIMPLTPNRIITGNATAWLEQTCDLGDCHFDLIDFASRELIVRLPDAFTVPGARYVVSPDAHYVLRVDPDGGASLFTVADGGITWVIGDGMEEPRWAADSSFVVWLDTMSEEPRLKMMFLEPRAWIAVGFDEIGAGLPDGAELVILS